MPRTDDQKHAGEPTKYEKRTGRCRTPKASWAELSERGHAKVLDRRDVAAARADEKKRAKAVAKRPESAIPESWRYYPVGVRPAKIVKGVEVEKDGGEVVTSATAMRFAQIMGRMLVSVVPIRPRKARGARRVR